MRASRAGTVDLDPILADRPIWKCQQCGLCSGICPSERAGGIRPIDILTRASLGMLDLREDRSLWLCAVCNSCTERCQMGVEPAETISLLRSEAAALGNIPRHFSEEAKLFMRSGLSFPNTGMTKKLRKDLGLEDLTVPAETMEQLALLLKRTKLGASSLNDQFYLFRGCLIPTRLPFLERSSLFVLDKLGVKYEQMTGATCCVEPIGLRSLAEDTWLIVTARMLAIAEKNGRDLLSLCNGCYLSLEESRQALEDAATRERANAVLAEVGLKYTGNVKVRHFAEIVREAGEEKVRSLVNVPQERLKLAAHPGCHMVRPSTKLKIDDHFAPKVLDEIASWCGSHVVVSEKWPKCCGGGIASIDEKVSARMLEDATSSFRPGGANCILTPCPFCFVQFDIRQKEGLPVLYLSELLALAFGATPEQIGLKYHKTRLP